MSLPSVLRIHYTDHDKLKWDSSERIVVQRVANRKIYSFLFIDTFDDNGDPVQVVVNWEKTTEKFLFAERFQGREDEFAIRMQITSMLNQGHISFNGIGSDFTTTRVDPKTVRNLHKYILHENAEV